MKKFESRDFSSFPLTELEMMSYVCGDIAIFLYCLRTL